MTFIDGEPLKAGLLLRGSTVVPFVEGIRPLTELRETGNHHETKMKTRKGNPINLKEKGTNEQWRGGSEPRKKQGKIHGYHSCVRVGRRSDDECHWGILAGAVRLKC